MSKNTAHQNIKTGLKIAVTGEVVFTRRVSVYKEPEFLQLVNLIRDCDVGFTNLEGLPGNFKGYTYANLDWVPMSGPSYIADELRWLGFNLVSIANNHALDSGPENMLSAMEFLDKAGVVYAGAGKDLDWARMPGYLETEKGLVAMVASVTGEQSVTYYQQHTRASKPGGGYPGRPGVNGIRNEKCYNVDQETWNELQKVKKKFTEYSGQEKLEVQRIKREDGKEELLLLGNRFVRDDKISTHWLMHKGDVEANLKRVTDAHKLADWTIMSHHSHEGIPYSDVGTQPPAAIVKYAHDCIDAGADAYLGHGVHAGQGFEIYKNKPIFYSLSWSIFSVKGIRRIPPERYEVMELGHDSTPSDFFQARVFSAGEEPYSKWLKTLLAVFTLDGEKGARHLTELKLYPIDSYKPGPQLGVRPVIVKDQQKARQIIEHYGKLSQPFGTEIRFKDGIGIVNC